MIEIFLFFFNIIFVSSHMYPEKTQRKETKVTVDSMNIGYDIYSTLPGIFSFVLSV